jgi:hypothetical protein
MTNFDQTTYLIPSGNGDGQIIGINIEEIVKAETRLQDVAIVNIHTAPELLATFNKAWLDLQKIVSLLTKEKLMADNAFSRARAEALLDCTTDYLKAKGHTKPSADLRNALMEIDPRVTQAKERLDEIRVILMYLSGKQEAFREGFSSIKKLVAAGQLPLAHHGNGERPESFTPTKQTINYQQKQPDLDDPLALPDGFK